MNNVEVWAKGELLAYKYLKKQKYKILERNYKTNIGELDIIAKDKNIIVFVEVKAKTNTNFGLPREMVTEHKIFKIEQVAQQYIKQKKITDKPIRFDVIEVLNDKINHIISAW